MLNLLKKVFVTLNSKLYKFYPDSNKKFVVDNRVIYLNMHDTPMSFFRRFNLYEPKKTMFVKKFLKQGMCFIDVGANRGFFSSLSAKIVGPNGLVLAFEPNPESFYWLKKASEEWECKKKLYNHAVSDTDEYKKLFIGIEPGYSSLNKSETTKTESINTRCLPLDFITTEMGLNSVDLIKVDVEGSDLKVISGAISLINSGSTIVMDVDLTTFAERVALYDLLIGLDCEVYSLDYVQLNEINEDNKEIIAGKNITAWISLQLIK